jgi:hypothetical protein
LNEYNVKLCHPGNSGNTPNFWKNTYGHPNRGGGTWTVCNKAAPPDPSTGCGENTATGSKLYSTNQFQDLTGSGTDSMQTNGARLTAAWSGTVTTSQ